MKKVFLLSLTLILISGLGFAIESANVPTKNEQKSKLSQEYQEKMHSTHSHHSEKQKACMADKERYCPNVQPGEGRIINCLKAHQSELSPACREMMERE